MVEFFLTLYDSCQMLKMLCLLLVVHSIVARVSINMNELLANTFLWIMLEYLFSISKSIECHFLQILDIIQERFVNLG